MSRTKVINEIIDIVPLLRCLDTELKKNVYMDLIKSWYTMDEIEEQYGSEGGDALVLMERLNLVDTKWVTKDNETVKSYHTYYDNINIMAHAPLYELIDMFHVGAMSDEVYKKMENEIFDMVGEDGCFTGEIMEKFNISSIFLKTFVKRSPKLVLKGQKVLKLK